MLDSARDLLDAAYSRLGFSGGDLLSAATEPDESTSADWVNKGDWLSLAKKAGAERVFFVNDYPVIVFAEQSTTEPSAWMRYFNSVWCMARPQILFLARAGELSVLNLTKQPARPGETLTEHDRLLVTVRATADVQDQLYNYRRERVESGRLFEDSRFGFDDRADRALVRDLGRVRDALIGADLSASYAHALIGRSIFIRYLEDRRVLTEEYFRKIARGKRDWNDILDKATSESPDFGAGHPIFYPHVLTNKAFTYVLFTQLARDFNGDMFPFDHDEEQAVGDQHLRLMHRFLLGGKDENLFFFAYRFDIIPIELISSIYENFYSFDPKKRRDEGSYYTPSALVDFVLSETLTDDLLAQNPRVLDPACGSGIFLVEAFRRIVRYRVGNARRSLNPQELRDILRDQIAGIDISSEAIRVAAFSLYLAMLHYLDPPNILKHKRLPSLKYATRTKTNRKQHFDILVAGDAFRIKETVSRGNVRKRFLSKCADVIVGNPPWGAPQKNVPEELKSDGGIGWCEARSLAVGDKERSQTFIHRAMDLLRLGGRAGLLVSTGVFFKRHKKTQLFRQQWLENVALRKVINFAAVRDAFFQNGSAEGETRKQGAIAPFAAVIFDKNTPPEDNRFTYWSAKETAFVKCVQAVVLNRADMRAANQSEYMRDETLWKIYWWGGHRDAALIRRLRLDRSFGEVLDPKNDNFRIGFLEAKKNQKPSGWLRKFKEFPTAFFERYSELPVNRFRPVPKKVKRRCTKDLYSGPRLLIKRGVSSDDAGSGRIVARYETEKFCFRHSIYCMLLKDFSESDSKILLAILWSSLTRYYLFMTSGTWGLWHDEVLKEVLATIPIRLSANDDLRARLVTTVDALRSLPPEIEDQPLFAFAGLPKGVRDSRIRDLERHLECLVYELFELDDSEKDRVEELCSLELDLFYRGMESDAIRALDWRDEWSQFGRRVDLGDGGATENALRSYLRVFLDQWEPQLKDQDGRLRWRVVRPPEASSMMAVVFETETAAEPLFPPSNSDQQEWASLLMRLDESVREPTRSKRVYIDGLIRIVTDSEIAIIKRNEHRLWTRSSARDDAEASMVLAMQLNPTWT